MKIASSTVAMSSQHDYFSYKHIEKKSIEGRASNNIAGAILSLSEANPKENKLEALEDYEKRKKQYDAKQRQENMQKNMQSTMEQMRESQKTNEKQNELSRWEDPEIQMLRQMLAILRGEKGKDLAKYVNVEHHRALDMRSESQMSFGFSSGAGGMNFNITTGKSSSMAAAESMSVEAGILADAFATSSDLSSRGNLWHKVTASSGFAVEAESTSFQTRGIARTEDGRELNFGLEMNLSRAVMEKIDSLSVEEYIYTDPLVINLKDNPTHVSDQKFYFDIDSDGKEDEISFAGEGSGFLALDKNGDGKINDGSELFGTKSGNGFKDLAAYDEDGNGWIDENDTIFSKLKVWTKDADGRDHLLDLKKADVGAIYLGSADTQYSLKGADGQTNGMLRQTGIYLKESNGNVGTLAHVDLAL